MFLAARNLLVKLPQSSSGAWAPSREKHVHRYSKEALQQARARHNLQQRNKKAFQSINLEYQTYQQQLNRQVTTYGRKASELMHATKHIENKTTTRVTASDRAANMEAARHLLELQVGKRKEMKDNKRRRRQTFTAQKKWH